MINYLKYLIFGTNLTYNLFIKYIVSKFILFIYKKKAN